MALRVDQSAVEAVLGRDEYFRRFSFDPLVQKYTEEIEAAERIVVIHPDWWGHLPAMAKGWVDRVLRPGVAYEYSGNEFFYYAIMYICLKQRQTDFAHGGIYVSF